MTSAETAFSDARCRATGAADMLPVLSMGETPLADILLRADELEADEPRFPLDVAFSPSSALLQLVATIPGDLAYDDDYPYFSSLVPGLVDHFGGSARRIIEEHQLGPASHVVEAASNDGYMLRVFAEHGVSVLGIDPASGPVKVAVEAGVPTIHGYFTADGARTLGRKADVFIANNLLNLVPDPDDFAMGVQALLKEDGVAVLEVPYAVAMIDQCAYDSIFHQNASYFTLTSIERLFRVHDFGILSVERIPTFGGSLRVTLAPGRGHGPTVEALLADEAARGVDAFDYYADFGRRAVESRDALVTMLEALHDDGARIAAYGAGGGMATTLLTYAGIDNRLVEYAVDSNPYKHGRYTPGSRLRIDTPDRLLADEPDYVLLLAWNYADEIMSAHQSYVDGGGRFIVPVPEPRIVP